MSEKLNSSHSNSGEPFAIGIKWVLFALVLLFVLSGSAVSIFLGYNLTNEAVIGEAQRRIELDLRSGWAEYNRNTEKVRTVARLVSMIQKTHDILSGKPVDPLWAREKIEEIRKNYGLDILTIINPEGTVIMRARPPYKAGDIIISDPVIAKGLRGKEAFGTVIASKDALLLEGEGLVERARLEVEETPMAAHQTTGLLEDGMMIKAAEPVFNESGVFIGFVYAGVLLNRNFELTDTIRDTVFKNEIYKEKPLGTATIFQWDVRVSTNVIKEDGSRAIGTRVSKAVYEKVLETGQPFYDRAFVVNDWYISAYDPIKDPEGKVIGILYMGVLEKKFLDYKNRLINSFIGLTIFGILVAVLLAFALSFLITKPIRRLAEVSKEVSRGNFLARVNEESRLSEIARLNRAFNGMADAVVRRGNELYDANRELSKSNVELKQLNSNYMDMLGFVTHELKSPLASMIFGLETLKEGYLGELKPEQRNVIDTVEKNAEYLNEMIQNYLNLSRIERGELHFSPARLNFKLDVIDPITVQIARQLESNNMVIKCNVPDNIELVGDVNLLKIVMDNLLSNAVKYGNSNSPIRIGYKKLHADRFQFNVFNEGKGIPEKEIGKLFKKFSRLELSEMRFKRGTGLGLFITMEIIERHGGAIWAESKEESWTNFIFILPKTPPEN